ncbi:MAG: alpha/beta hydrolase [Clostridia bacterium]|nr:alpha/beta hydrolase [Clostridia bacterium]
MIGSIESDDLEMEYMRFGTGKKIFVILPGLSVQSVLASAPSIEKQYGAFCEEYTVYLFDRRRDLPEGYTVYGMAEDTANAMESLGLEDVCLFGASQGGMMAQAIALERPGLVKKLALGSSACRISAKSRAVLEEWLGFAKAGDAKKLYVSFGEKLFPAETFAQYRDAFEMMSQSVTADDLKRFITLAEASVGFDVKDRLKEIKCPVLALGDLKDAVLGAGATLEIADALSGNPGFELYMYPGYGHAAYDTAPDYKQRLLSFFSKQEG